MRLVSFFRRGQIKQRKEVVRFILKESELSVTYFDVRLSVGNEPNLLWLKRLL